MTTPVLILLLGGGPRPSGPKQGRGKGQCHLLPPLGAGKPRSRLLSGAHTIWPAVSVGRYMMERVCFAAPSTVKGNKIHCSNQGRKLLFSSSKGCFPFEPYSSIRRHAGIRFHLPHCHWSQTQQLYTQLAV